MDDLESIILNEVVDREKINIISDTTNTWNLKQDINEHIYKTEIDSET